MSRQFIQSPICHDMRPCFGAVYGRDGYRRCKILTETFEKNGMCSFCKAEEADIPNLYVRRMIEDSGLMNKQIALHMGISPNHFANLMASPLSEKNRKRIRKAVRELEGRRKNV